MVLDRRAGATTLEEREEPLDVDPLFRDAPQQRDRIALRRFRFNGNARRWGNFQFTLRRRADGYRDGDWFRVWGKGAAFCDADEVSFFVISLGTMPAR